MRAAHKEASRAVAIELILIRVYSLLRGKFIEGKLRVVPLPVYAPRDISERTRARAETRERCGLGLSIGRKASPGEAFF